MHISFAIVGPHSGNSGSFCNLVVLEWIEVIFDMNKRVFVFKHNITKEGVG